MSNNLSKNILSTIIYYDILDYPLTAFEIWKYMISQSDKEEIKLAEVIKELESEEVKKYIEEFQGFYFLKNRKELVKQRIERNKISESKFKIIKRAVFWLRFVPFARAIMVTGRVAMKNADKKSDLDLLIILKNKKIFTGRLLVTLMTHFLGRRRYGRKITNRICLNYFITDKSLKIDSRDLFSSSEYAFAVPVFGENIFRKFQEANEWIKNYKPNYQPDAIGNLKIIKDTFLSKWIRKACEIIFDFNFIEKNLKKWQIKRIVSDPRTYQAGSAVSASDERLIFLPEPQGPKIFEEYQKKIAEYKI